MRFNIAILPLSLVLLAGCATTQRVEPSVYRDKQEQLVGKSVQQRIVENSEAILQQLELLNQAKYGVQTKTHVGNYDAVTHNNNLDARVGSRNTVPEELAKRKPEIFNKNIEKIQWNNSSLNTLGKNFANVLGYDFAIQPGGMKDKDVVFNVQNMTVEDALNKLGSENNDVVDILVVDEVKMLTFIYK